MKTLTALTAAALTTVALTGCSDDAAITQADADPVAAPALPSTDTMDFDFSFFGDGDEARAALATGRAALGDEARWNWFNAVVRVLFLNVAMDAAFAPPTHAFAVAIHQDPVLLDDGTFLWSYEWTSESGEKASIDLTGRIEGVHVDWEMRVTSNEFEPPLEDDVWFYGQSSLVEDAGHWIFLAATEDGDEVARLDWSADGEHGQLSYENIDPDGEDLGDRVEYESTFPMIEVRYRDASEDEDTVIRWNETTGVGSIIAPDYNDGEPACWGEDQYDVDCPTAG